MTIDNPAVLVSACKRAESGEGYTIRVFETANKESERNTFHSCTWDNEKDFSEAF